MNVYESENENEKQYHILIAEDSQLQRIALIDLLEIHNFKVTNAANGNNAIDIIKNEEGEFDLILLDYNMPGIVGDEE